MSSTYTEVLVAP